MQPGELRHCVTLERPVTTTRPTGESVTTWQKLATVRAKVEPLSGRDYFAAQRYESAVTHRVTMRYRSDVGHATRLVFGSRVLHVESVIDVGERHVELMILCVEIKSGVNG